MQSTYFRWTLAPTGGAGQQAYKADILGAATDIWANPKTGTVSLSATISTHSMTPDEARMIGVRLIEAAALADDGRSIRQTG